MNRDIQTCLQEKCIMVQLNEILNNRRFIQYLARFSGPYRHKAIPNQQLHSPCVCEGLQGLHPKLQPKIYCQL